MDKNRKELIDRFQKWLDTNPRKQLIAAQCATIAEEYHKEQLQLYDVVERSEQLKCDHQPKRYDKKYTSCKKCDMILQMKP